MTTKKFERLKEAPEVIASVKADAKREDYEIELGKLMHKIGKQQAVCVAENQKLQTLQNAANTLDVELTKLDGQ